MAYHLMLETSFLLDQTAMFSTISPNEVVDLALTNENLILGRPIEPSISGQNHSNTEVPLDIRISNEFDQTNSQSQISSPEGNTSLSFEAWGPETFPGFSISTSIQKVMDDSLRFLSDSSQNKLNPLGFGEGNKDCRAENDNQNTDVAEIVDNDKPKVGYERENSLNNLPDSSDTKNNIDADGDKMQSKDEINSVLDSESILVLMSSRNASQGTFCEHRHFSHIKFYRSFDVPLGKFLQDNLLNQRLQCKTCDQPPEAHFFYYAHHNKQLTIQARNLPARKSLPGEAEGKLWMWSRCGRCKLHDGSSKSTKRVLISTAARGLSFGKFLELSFSNHSSFSSPSSCGHSYHKDFLYFFGLGPMVAMFKYSTVVTYSVSLPPLKMEFNYSVGGEFVKKDTENVYSKGVSMFLEIEKSLMELRNRYVGVTLNIQGLNMEFLDIMEMLKQEKSQFEVEIQNSTKNGSEGGIICKLLSLNRVRFNLLLVSCIWDRRLRVLMSSDFKVISSDLKDDGSEDAIEKSIDALEHSSQSELKQDSFVENSDFPIIEIPIDGHVEGSNEDQSLSTRTVKDGSALDDSSVKPSSEDHFDSSLESHSCLTIPVEGATCDSNNSVRLKHLLTVPSDLENGKDWIWAPFIDIRRDHMEDLQRECLQKLESCSYAAESTAQKVITDEGSRLHIPIGHDAYIVSDFEDEFSSIIACALALIKDSTFTMEDQADDVQSLPAPRLSSLTSSHWSSFSSVDNDTSTIQEDLHSSFDSSNLLESLVSFGASHPEVPLGSGKNPGARKYSVVCVYASEFRELRDRCCTSEVDYIASLSRCRNWDAKGGKSKSVFAKTLDDRFIIKEIKRTEFESFMKFAKNYFDYMKECAVKGNQTCLAKILGIYQVVIRGAKNGKEARHDLLVMENLSFGRQISRQYDLKGALHARLKTAGNDSEDVLLDQNFVNDMNVSPLYVSRKSKRNLQRAVYNDTNFLNLINVMDYSLLVGIDTQKRELVCGIIDYLRQYTWDKQLESWVKSSLVPKNLLPTIISPKEYKKRFRKFIDTHFLSVPDHWCSRRSSNPCKLCGPTSR